jgi:hypothetical protein
MILLHVCEVCDKSETLDIASAFEQGWDYPPRMGAFGIISPRTCGSCGIEDTLWWQLMVDKVDVKDLDEKYKKTLTRILAEPESITV